MVMTFFPAGQQDPPYPLDDRRVADSGRGRLPHLPRRLHQRPQAQHFVQTCSLRSQANLKPEIAMLFTVDFFLLSLNLYSLLCVVSQYQEYKAGRGRAVDEDSFRRLAAVRYLAQPTATSVLSTRRGTHTNVHDGHSPSGDANGGLALDPGVLRLAVPPPPHSKKQAGAGAGLGAALPPASGMRKHVKFPDMCNARVILDEDSSPGDSPGAEPCGYMEEGSTGMEWPMDEKALLSAA
ncbi:Transmembrane protease serine 11C [Frankliniella fusca]|uniref:Transmembrane protease serine 11C n=1 Tax=Frankliniella fusca TaxID=407009 RepID=A0AAE1H1I0_9NEOP|nr:Transmembrane protease serine 11C [Frankliniella fusca]